MRVSEKIAALAALMAEHGDLRLVGYNDDDQAYGTENVSASIVIKQGPRGFHAVFAETDSELFITV